MSKQNLKEQNEKLLKEVVTLREQIKHLNENTIVQSMNDMKEQYNKLKEESVPREIYYEISFEKKRLLKLINTIDMINNSNLRKISDISFFIKRYNETCNSEYKLPERFVTNCENDLSNVNMKLRFIDEFIRDIDDDDSCSCYNHDN